MRKIKEDEKVALKIIEKKKKRLIKLIDFCKSKDYHKTVVFLENALHDIFSGIEKK